MDAKVQKNSINKYHLLTIMLINYIYYVFN